MTTPEYPDNWDTLRKEVYQRDDYECQNCGSQGGYNGDKELHAHHIVPKSRDGKHKKSNLVTVCDECHSKVHGFEIGSSHVMTSFNPDTTPDYMAISMSAFALPLFLLYSLQPLNFLAAVFFSFVIWVVVVVKLIPQLVASEEEYS